MPPRPWPVPPVLVGEVVWTELEGERFLHFPQRVIGSLAGPGEAKLAPGARLVELPDEAYLRELGELDTEDPEAVKAFCEEWGRLGDPRWETLTTSRMGRRFDVEFLGAYHETVELIEKLRGTGVTEFLAHPREIAVHAVALRNCAAVWESYASGRLFDPDGIKELRRSWAHREDLYGLPPPESPTDALEYLAFRLDHALAPFRPGVDFEDRSPDAGRPPWTTTYPAMALQLFNHIAEGNPYTICHNEKCRRRFVRQRGGRGEFDYRRTEGVKYCSRNCADAQMAREYRRRKRAAEREKEDDDA